MSEINEQEHEAIKQAVLDYVEGVYNVDPSRIERSVHPDLTKGGFFQKEAESSYSFISMTYAQMVELSKNYNKDGRMPQDAPKEVIIFDVLDQIASVKLVAWWGIDYMHLAKYEGKWKIVNVLWQTHANQNNRLADTEQLSLSESLTI